jgi:hypothetical protein
MLLTIHKSCQEKRNQSKCDKTGITKIKICLLSFPRIERFPNLLKGIDEILFLLFYDS